MLDVGCSASASCPGDFSIKPSAFSLSQQRPHREHESDSHQHPKRIRIIPRPAPPRLAPVLEASPVSPCHTAAPASSTTSANTISPPALTICDRLSAIPPPPSPHPSGLANRDGADQRQRLRGLDRLRVTERVRHRRHRPSVPASQKARLLAVLNVPLASPPTPSLSRSPAKDNKCNQIHSRAGKHHPLRAWITQSGSDFSQSRCQGYRRS